MLITRQILCFNLQEEEKEEIDETSIEQVERKTKDGVAVDMLTGSEAEDSTSESSSDSDADNEGYYFTFHKFPLLLTN